LAAICFVVTLTVLGGLTGKQGQVVYSGANPDTLGEHLQCAPEFVVHKACNREKVDAGSVLTYTISYSNTSSISATDVYVADLLSLYTDFVTATGSYRPAIPSPGDVLYWDIGILPGGASGSLMLTVRVTTPLTNGLVITNQAGIACSEAIYASSEVVSAEVTSTPVLSIKKSSYPSSVGPGEMLTYTISYSNTGNMTASGVWNTDILDSKVSVITTYPPYDDLNDQVLGWNIGQLSLLGPHIITVATVVTDVQLEDSSITNTAFIDSPQAELVSDTEVTDVHSEPDVWYVYFPFIAKRYCNFLDSTDNYTFTRAQPVLSEVWYCAHPDDEDDYYYFVITATTTVSAEVHNYTPVDHGDLVLYRETDSGPPEGLIKNWGRGGESMYILSEEVGPGKYFILIYTVPGYYDNNSFYYFMVKYD